MFAQHRLQCILLTLADTGTGIDEVLSLAWTDIDFDNLLLTVTGKGSKQRKIPFSIELRKYLWKRTKTVGLVFTSTTGRKLGRRDVLRDAKTSVVSWASLYQRERFTLSGTRSL